MNQAMKIIPDTFARVKVRRHPEKADQYEVIVNGRDLSGFVSSLDFHIDAQTKKPNMVLTLNQHLDFEGEAGVQCWSYTKVDSDQQQEIQRLKQINAELTAALTTATRLYEEQGVPFHE